MALLEAFGLPEAPMHEWLCPPGTGYTLRFDPSVWSRLAKCEVVGRAPAESEEDILRQERDLWIAIEKGEDNWDD
jgi:hypothetical protein